MSVQLSSVIGSLAAYFNIKTRCHHARQIDQKN